MSISSAITAAQGRVADCYTAISNKGGTLPATQNLTNMPTAINSIPSGGVSTKYGCTIDNFLTDNGTEVMKSDFSGVNIVLPNTITSIGTRAFSYKFHYLMEKSPVSFSAPNVTYVGARAFEYTFNNCSNITSFSITALKTVSEQSAFNSAFYISSMSSASMPEIETISGSSAFSSAWFGCKLNSIDFSKLKTVSANSVFSSAFAANSVETGEYLTNASFQLLESIGAQNVFSSAFSKRYNLSSLSFPALKTTSFGSYLNQFNNMFDKYTGSTATGGCTVHFPSNLSTVVSGLTGYPNFGGTSGYVTLAFDLPATS